MFAWSFAKEKCLSAEQRVQLRCCCSRQGDAGTEVIQHPLGCFPGGAGMWQELAAGPWGCCWGSQMGQSQKGEGDAGCWLSPGLWAASLCRGKGSNGPGAFLQGANHPLEKDGNAGGGKALSLGAVGTLGKGDPHSKGCRAPCPVRRAVCGSTRAGAEQRGLGELWAGSLGKPGAQGAGASLLAQLALLLFPVAHLEQRFRGCPWIDARPGCQREAALLLARAMVPATA